MDLSIRELWVLHNALTIEEAHLKSRLQAEHKRLVEALEAEDEYWEEQARETNRKLKSEWVQYAEQLTEEHE